MSVRRRSIALPCRCRLFFATPPERPRRSSLVSGDRYAEMTGERYGELRRIRARYHGEVNGYFLCDRGRYGYEFVNHERRIRFYFTKKKQS